MRILGVDFGDARTGLAISDEGEVLASPLTVIHERNAQKCAEAVARWAAETDAGLIVVGYPKRTDNTVGERAEKSAAFAKEIEALTGRVCVLWDERLTTVQAHQYLNETNTRGKKRKEVIDAVAAVIILESYLEYRHHQK